MGVAVSDWHLASTVARLGQLGVVSGTALDVVHARRLADGDQGGHLRRAYEHFPVPAMADSVLSRWFRPAARPADGGNINWGRLPSSNGGRGGNSGKAISSVNVVAGQTINYVTGTRGTGGISARSSAAQDGTDGTATYVTRNLVELVRAEGGKKGKAPEAFPTASAGADGAPGGGSGGIVSIGGGATGGAGGQGNIQQNGQTPTNNGSVIFEY